MNHLLPDEARKWLGTPYKHQGRQIHRGVNCLGLVAEAMKAAGHKVNDRIDYSRYPSGNLLITGLASQLKEVSLDEIDSGDILVMAQRTQANHVMIYDHQSKTVIHSYFRCGCVVEQPIKLYEGMIKKAFRYE